MRSSSHEETSEEEGVEDEERVGVARESRESKRAKETGETKRSSGDRNRPKRSAGRVASEGEEKSSKGLRLDSGSTDRTPGSKKATDRTPEAKRPEVEFSLEKVQGINGKPMTATAKKAIQSLMAPGSDNFWGKVKGLEEDTSGEQTAKK